MAVLSIDEARELVGDELSAQLAAGDYGRNHET